MMGLFVYSIIASAVHLALATPLATPPVLNYLASRQEGDVKVNGFCKYPGVWSHPLVSQSHV